MFDSRNKGALRPPPKRAPLPAPRPAPRPAPPAVRQVVRPPVAKTAKKLTPAKPNMLGGNTSTSLSISAGDNVDANGTLGKVRAALLACEVALGELTGQPFVFTADRSCVVPKRYPITGGTLFAKVNGDSVLVEQLAYATCEDGPNSCYRKCEVTV